MKRQIATNSNQQSSAMSKTVLNYILKFILLVLTQAVIFNNIVLFNVAVAFVFIYLIVSMPVSWNTNVSLTVGFLAGLIVDIFSDTLGYNALSCTVLTFVRKPVFHLYMQNEEDLGGLKPSITTMGYASYLKYLVTMVAIYCICFFSVESFEIFNPVLQGLRIVCSTAFTFILIYALDSISSRKNEKRL